MAEMERKVAAQKTSLSLAKEIVPLENRARDSPDSSPPSGQTASLSLASAIAPEQNSSED
jgi:hypothetical protein